MTAPDELQRAVERLSGGMGKYGFANVYNDDVQLLLSERAELLATVERMRRALEPFAKMSEKFGHLTVVEVCKPHPLNPSPIIAPLLVRDLTEARAALTTEEGAGSPIGQNDQPGLAFSGEGVKP